VKIPNTIGKLAFGIGLWVFLYGLLYFGTNLKNPGKVIAITILINYILFTLPFCLAFGPFDFVSIGQTLALVAIYTVFFLVVGPFSILFNIAYIINLF